MDRMITTTSAPAYGDIRTMGRGSTIWIESGAEVRKDWGRLLDAISSAISHGADVRWMN